MIDPAMAFAYAGVGGLVGALSLVTWQHRHSIGTASLAAIVATIGCLLGAILASSLTTTRLTMSEWEGVVRAALPFVYTATAVLTGGLSLFSWRNRDTTGSVALTGVLLAITLWLLSILAAGQVGAVSALLQWATLALVGLSSTVAFLFLFALRYAGYEDLLRGRRAFVLAIHPVAFGLLALTNAGTGVELLGLGGHDLVYASVEVGQYGNGDITWGDAFWVHTAYSYALVATSTVLVLKTALISNDTYRWQSTTVAVAILVPWFANVLDLAFEEANGLLALGFGVSGVLLVVSVHRFELSNVAPVARPVVMEAVADGVLVVDRRDRIVDLNRRARDLLGLDDADVLGATASDVLPDALDEFADAETAPERERVHVDDRTLDVETTPFGEDGDEQLGRVFVLRDVTEQHAYHRELERKTERLDRFASVVSHDLRNPLSVARGYAELAEESGDAEAFERVHDAHDRMDSLIEDVLLMAREGETSTDPEPIGLGDLAERAWATVDVGDATLEVPDSSTIHADPDRTVQLFENLFRNSVEHGSTSSRTQSDDSVEHGSTGNRTRSGDSVEHGGPDVTVTVGTIGDGGFYVADDGDGIGLAVQDDLFETGVTGGSGTGIGLAIVERIASAHGWTVSATDSETGGARFEFRGVDATSPSTSSERPSTEPQR